MLHGIQSCNWQQYFAADTGRFIPLTLTRELGFCFRSECKDDVLPVPWLVILHHTAVYPQTLAASWNYGVKRWAWCRKRID